MNPQNALTFWNRGLIWKKKNDTDRAIADYDEAIRLDPQFSEAFNSRGVAWNKKDDYDHAIADYSEAIRLNPQYAIAFFNRGNSRYRKGEFDRALTDYSEAIRLNPQYASALNNRGYAWFVKGEFPLAASDYAESQKFKPDTDKAIMLYLARARSGNDAKEELTLNTNGSDDKKWPAPVVALYLGKSKSGTVIPLAADPDPKIHKKQLCAADFYLGEWHLLRGEKKQASMFFTEAQKDCPHNDSDYYNSVSEIRRLK